MTKRQARRKLAVSISALLLTVTAIFGGIHLYVNSPGYGLPYRASFTSNDISRWSALGGTWEIAGGAMRNDSNDRGAKLLTGSSSWKDYLVEGDLQLLGTGSVGLLARISDAEVGENSFKGYFAGVRTVDNSLVLGSYDFAYHEMNKIVLPDRVRPFRWYHLKLRVDGCQIVAAVSADNMPEVRTAPASDPDCFPSGSVGLRSNGTGGIWKNFSVVPAASSTVVAASSKPAAPASDAATASPAPRTRRGGRAAQVFSTPAQSIASLLFMPQVGSPVTSIRGSVVLIRPALYVQDSNGGVEVQSDGSTPLKIGDEVEVTGEVDLEKFAPVIRKAQIRRLREATPISPLVFTANQLAEGYYDGRFVQAEGNLRTMTTEPDGSISLDLDAGSQSFHAIFPPGRSRSLLDTLEPESRLRLKGVCVMDARFNKASDPFVLLMRSPEDVDIVAGAPWWRPSTLILASLVLLGLIFTLNHLYLLAKHWRLRAVADERERLAHEIHDTLAQSFAGIGFQLQAIRNSLPRDAATLEGQVDLAISMARNSHVEARRSIANLRPESLGSVGLLPALRECAERMVKNGQVKIETHSDDGGWTIPLRIKDTLYRIGQEAIANSIRHADPATIRISLKRTRSSISLTVEDDGTGFIADSDHAGFGLRGMRNRAESISAKLNVKSTPGSGTSVEVKAAVGTGFLFRFLPLPRLAPKDI
jgi:signal transduction histidine kinase